MEERARIKKFDFERRERTDYSNGQLARSIAFNVFFSLLLSSLFAVPPVIPPPFSQVFLNFSLTLSFYLTNRTKWRQR